jgi:hypothetical protein
VKYAHEYDAAALSTLAAAITGELDKEPWTPDPESRDSAEKPTDHEADLIWLFTHE